MKCPDTWQITRGISMKNDVYLLLSYHQAIENTFFYERVKMVLFQDLYLLVKLIAVYAGRNISFSSISDRKWKEETLKTGKYVWYSKNSRYVSHWTAEELNQRYVLAHFTTATDFLSILFLFYQSGLGSNAFFSVIVPESYRMSLASLFLVTAGNHMDTPRDQRMGNTAHGWVTSPAVALDRVWTSNIMDLLANMTMSLV